MRSAVPNTSNPLRTHLKHTKLSLCPIEISPQHKTNSLDANIAHCSVFQQVIATLTVLTQIRVVAKAKVAKVNFIHMTLVAL